MIKGCHFLLDADYHFLMDEIRDGKLEGTYSGTIVGNVSLVQGKVNNALYTNGINQWVNIGNHRDKCLGNLTRCSKGFVLALWLKAHQDVSGGGNEYYISSGGQTSLSIGMTLLQQNGNLLAVFRNESMFWSASVPDFESHLWYHVVLAWTGGRGLQVYFDGCLCKTEEGTISASNVDPSVTDFVFGNANNALDDGTYAGEMTLDEIRRYGWRRRVENLHGWYNT